MCKLFAQFQVFQRQISHLSRGVFLLLLQPFYLLLQCPVGLLQVLNLCDTQKCQSDRKVGRNPADFFQDNSAYFKNVAYVELNNSKLPL